MILVKILLFIISSYIWPPSRIKWHGLRRICALLHRHVCLVGYFVLVGLGPCCFEDLVASEDRGGKKWALPLEQVTPLFAGGSLFRTQAGSCPLLMTEHPLRLRSDISSSSPSIPFHPPPPAPRPVFTIPNLGKIGHSPSPIRSFSGAPCSSWDLNTGTKIYTGNQNEVPPLATGLSTCIPARVVCARDLPDCISPARRPQCRPQTSDPQNQASQVFGFVRKGAETLFPETLLEVILF